VSQAGDLTRDDQIAIHELYLCQAHLDTSYSRSWQSGTLILAGALAALVLMLQITASDLASATATTAFGVGGVSILIFWLLFLQRERAFQKVSVRRARELERQLTMRRQALISAVDSLIERDLGSPELVGLSSVERAMVDEVYSRVYTPRIRALTPRGTTDTLYRIGFVVITGWVFVTLWRWLIFTGVLD